MSSPAVEGKKPMSYWVHVGIMFAIMIGFGFIPPFGGDITPFGMRVLGIFIGTFWGWIFVDFFWSSLTGVILLGLTQYGTIQSVFIEGLSNSMTVNILLMFAFCAYLEKSGLLEYITYVLLSRKFLVGHPWRFTAMILFVMIPLSLMGAIYAALIILWGIFYKTCEKAGYKKGDMYVTYMVSAIASLGGVISVTFPFMPFTQLCFGLGGGAVGITELPAAQWSLMGIVTCLVMFAGILLVGKLLRVDVSKLNNLGDSMEQYRGRKMDSEQKFAGVLLIFFLLMLLVPSFLSAGPIKTFLNRFNIIGACSVCFVAIYVYQIFKGQKLFEFGDMVRNGVSWDLIMLFIVTFPLCTAMESADAGVISTVISVLMPIVDKLSPIVFLIMIMIVFSAITQVAHNLVLIIALTPSLAKICAASGIDPIMFTFVFCTAMLTSMATPAASAQSAMVFGQTDWVDRGQAFKAGFTTYFIYILIEVAVLLPVGMLIF